MSRRVVHYLNQFFGGIGGEDKAGLEPRFEPRPVGPGRLLEQLLGDAATVVGTVICGDNHFQEHREAALEYIRACVLEHHADPLVAGPAFNAGRYGLACDAVCELAASLGLPAVSGM